MTRTETSPTLATLVLDHKGDRSYERLSRDCGGEPTGKRLQQIATNPIKTFPDAETIQGVAQGLGVSVTDVVLASARSLGLQVRTDPGPAAVQLDPAVAVEETRDAVLAVVRAVRAAAKTAPAEQRGGGEDRGNATSTRESGQTPDNVQQGPWPEKEKPPPIPDDVAADTDYDPPVPFDSQIDPREED